MALDVNVRRHENTSLLSVTGNNACMTTKSRKDILAAQKPARANVIVGDRVMIDLSLA